MGEDIIKCPNCGTEGAVGTKCFNCGTEIFAEESSSNQEESTTTGNPAEQEGQTLTPSEPETGEQGEEVSIPVRVEGEDQGQDAESEPQNTQEESNQGQDEEVSAPKAD